ncbi:MAG: alpha/beta fold hydrolase [Gammaproteobacteria bacterium]|nr:alpha/beta fold hydrolase [Gammaproteobacteria bacterium]
MSSPGPGTRPTGALDWSVEGDTWPHARASRFVDAGGLRWHVQQMGEGPTVLLIHGTGASTHSWRALAPLLARQFTVIAPDLPGHGFTECPPRRRLSLPGMARAVAALCEALALRPRVVVGHSAGAAILLRCCLDASLAPQVAISVNGALLPFRGTAGYLFPPLAKLLFLNPLTPRVFARGAASRGRVARLIRGTGSQLDEAGIELYARLFTSPAHVAATLGMMANWDLRSFNGELPGLQVPLLLVAAENDLAVAPDDAERVRRMVPGARLARLPALGHLAHEEDADAVAGLITDFAAPDAAWPVKNDTSGRKEGD